MHNISKVGIILYISIVTFGPAKAHEFRRDAKAAPPMVDDLIAASDFDQLVMNAPDDGARWVLSRSLLWKPGSTLSACFLKETGSQVSRMAVINDAEYLVSNPSRPVNLNISFANWTATDCSNVGGSYSEDIRVSFTDGCCSAYVGRVSHNSVVAKGANVFLQDNLDDSTIKHELLHALGFQHEHQRPDSPCNFNYQVIETAYKWSEATVVSNFNKLDKNCSRLATSPAFDGASIMKYYFDPSFLKEGEKSPCYAPRATDLSSGDWEGLQTAYPANFDAAGFNAAVRSKRAAIVTWGANPPAALVDALQSLPSN